MDYADDNNAQAPTAATYSDLGLVRIDSDEKVSLLNELIANTGDSEAVGTYSERQPLTDAVVRVFQGADTLTLEDMAVLGIALIMKLSVPTRVSIFGMVNPVIVEIKT